MLVPPAEAIAQFVQGLAGMLIPFVSAAMAVGALAMAVIQTGKDLLPVRQAFQRRFLRRWLALRAEAARQQRSHGFSAERAWSDLVRLATGGDERALLELSVEQLCGQLNAAVTVVLDYPEDHPDLLGCLAASARAEDLARLTEPSNDADSGPRSQARVDARARVTHAVQRGLDGLQIALGFRWKRALQVAAFVLSYLIVLVALALVHGGASPFSGRILLVALLAGFLAPVSRDLLAALQRLRG